MKRQLIWSQRATDDANRIFEYIANNSIQNAMLVLKRIGDTAEGLAEIPTGHQGRVGGTHERLALKTPYIVAYRITPEGDVNILRVIHAARDWRAGEWPDD